MKIEKENISWQLDPKYNFFFQTGAEWYAIWDYEINDSGKVFPKLMQLSAALRAEASKGNNYWYWAEVPNDSLYRWSFIDAGFLPLVKDDKVCIMVRKGTPKVKDGVFTRSQDGCTFENDYGTVNISAMLYETADDDLDWLSQMLREYFQEALAFDDVVVNSVVKRQLQSSLLLSQCMDQLCFAGFEHRLLLAHSKRNSGLECLSYTEGGFVPMTMVEEDVYWAKIL